MVNFEAQTIGLIGAGHMASALLQGFLQAGTRPDNLWACDRNPEKLDPWDDLGLHTTESIDDLCHACDCLLLAVRPDQVVDVMMDLQRFFDHNVEHPSFLVSLAAGIPLDSITPFAPHAVGVLRAMPNIPASIGSGCTLLFAEEGTDETHKQACQQLFEQVGMVTWLEEEEQMHLATAVCGSGPAFILKCLEALANGAMLEGASFEDAQRWTKHTALGTARLAIESGATLAELKEQITSKGGVTEKGLAMLEELGIDAMMQSTLRAAVLRSQDIT